MSAKARRHRGRVFRWFERTLLGFGMTVVAFVVERRLLKAIKHGGVKAAPRTAGEFAGDETEPEEPPILPRQWKVSTATQEISDQSDG